MCQPTSVCIEMQGHSEMRSEHVRQSGRQLRQGCARRDEPFQPRYLHANRGFYEICHIHMNIT